RPRLRFFVLTFALLVSTLVVNRPDDIWWVAVSQGLVILLILSGGFLIQEVVNYSVGLVIDRFESGDQSDAEVRRISTQLRLLRRLANVVIAILAIGFALFTFPAVQGIGAGLLASAGVLSVIGGLAAQSVLGNLFAGIQLAFSNAIRVGDVVVVEGEWGTIGEITLSYVVVHIWDERRLIVPSTHFTSKSFETWTRKTSKILGTVYMDVDWRVPVDKVRAEFEKFVTQNPLWDKRTSSVLVTDATGGYVQLRFLISAEDSNKQWDLRCEVREHMVTWLQKNYPTALPVSRVSLDNPESSRKPRLKSPS
ncbi:MAG TPA: mechanosensitive ion channel family protein, partial [Pontimonas sp.]|nr:mechanosensitive ion channel family protein [Pontimonas sp.]